MDAVVIHNKGRVKIPSFFRNDRVTKQVWNINALQYSKAHNS